MSNEEIRVVIADDEPGMRMILRKMIEKADGFTLCAEADNGKDLLKLVEEYKPQVCFLDVEMPEMTGLECAKAIQDTDPRMILVFATAHDDYMAQAFEVYAFDYMVKPFKVERVMKTLERIRQVIGGRAQPQSEQAEKLEEHIKAIPARGASSGRIMLHHKDGVNFVNQADRCFVPIEIRVQLRTYLPGKQRNDQRLLHGVFFDFVFHKRLPQRINTAMIPASAAAMTAIPTAQTRTGRASSLIPSRIV